MRGLRKDMVIKFMRYGKPTMGVIKETHLGWVECNLSDGGKYFTVEHANIIEVYTRKKNPEYYLWDMKTLK